MSTSPVTLDFSKSQPIAEGQPAENTGDVQLDFSKSQPVNSDGSAPQSSIGPAPKQGFLEHALSLTQEGRAEHPVQAFVGDTAKKAAEFATIAGGTAGALAGPEAGAELVPGAIGAAGEAASKIPKAIAKTVELVKDALPEQATMDQISKVARIVHHLGVGTGGAAFLWHELFGK